MTIKHLFPVAKPTLDLNFAAERSLDPRITFSRSSIGTYMDATGILRTAAEDEPRFDHSGTGKSLGLLVEEFRTNELKNSDLSGLTEYGCDTENSTEVNPEGVASCKRIIVDAGRNSEGHRITQRNADFFDETTCSAFVKMDTHPYVLIGAGGQNNGYTAAFNIDPAFTGDRLLGQSGAGTRTNIGAGYESYANGWFRIWASGNTTGTDGWSLSISPDENTFKITNWDAAGTEAIFAYGGQYEYAAFVTSYIPTTGAPEDRAADICSIEGSNFSSWYNQTEGTILVDVSYLGLPDNTTLQNSFSFQTSNSGPRTTLTAYGANSRMRVRADTDGNVYPGDTFSVTKPRKCAVGYKINDLNFTFNGSRLGTDTSYTPTTSLNRLVLDTGHGGSPSSKRIARLSYYPRRLSDEQLQALTA